MSGIIAVVVAALVAPQDAPHPSTFALYEPPAIRPFEPASDFGAVAEGAEAGEAHRRPLSAPVTVDAYVGSYEFSPGETEIAYDQGVASAEVRADQDAGPLDGYWRASDPAGDRVFDLVRRDWNGAAEGGWRGPDGAGPAVVEGGSLRLEGLGAIELQREAEGWRGRLRADGRSRAVTLRRLR